MGFNESLNKILDDATKLMLIMLLGKNYRIIVVALWKDLFSSQTIKFLIVLKVTHLKRPKCGRAFDVEVEGVSDAGPLIHLDPNRSALTFEES